MSRRLSSVILNPSQIVAKTPTSTPNPSNNPELESGAVTPELTSTVQLPYSPEVLFPDSFPLEWSDITFTVKNAKGEVKHILQNVSGRAPVGQVTVIMGPSGWLCVCVVCVCVCVVCVCCVCVCVCVVGDSVIAYCM